MQLSEKIRRYIYAGYPILYINGFDENEIDTEIERAVISSETIKKENIVAQLSRQKFDIFIMN